MSSKPSDTCKIRILDKDYAINCGPGERDMLMKSVDFLNNRIKETRSSGSVTGGEKIIVMTALNIVYDYLSSEKETESEVEDNSQTTKKLKKMNKKIEAALHQHQQIELA
jgi:cell division protein ZapA